MMVGSEQRWALCDPSDPCALQGFALGVTCVSHGAAGHTVQGAEAGFASTHCQCAVKLLTQKRFSSGFYICCGVLGSYLVCSVHM